MYPTSSELKNILVNQGYLYLDNTDDFKRELEKTFELAYEFFSLPPEEKNQFLATTSITGYRDSGSEYSPDGTRDLNEAFYYVPAEARVFPEENQVFSKLLAQARLMCVYYNDLTKSLLDRMAQFYTGEIADFETDLYSVVQINYFQPALRTEYLLMGEHDDRDIFTLWTADNRGLEYKAVDNTYQQPRHGTDQLLIYCGELMGHLTGYEVKSFIHRVRNFPDIEARVAIMYFVDPNLGKKVKPWVQHPDNENIDIVQITAEVPMGFGLPRFQEKY